MRVAALYDIHGNLPALNAVLAELDAVRPDVIVVGGDFLMGPMPVRTLKRLRALGDRARFIRGNTERNLLRSMADNPIEPQAWAARAKWVAGRLDEAARVFLTELTLTLRIDTDGVGPVLFCHGTPHSDEEIITRATPAEYIASVLAEVGEATVVCGHTHMQFDRTVGAHRVVNAGSVGLPYEGNPGAYWALLGPEIELRRTGYDTRAAALEIMMTGFPAADDFARKYVLTSPSSDQAVQFFEAQANRGSPAPVRLAGVIKPGRGLAVPRMTGSAMIERLETFGGCPIVPGTLNVRLPGPLPRGPGWRYLPAAEIGPEWSQETGQAGYFVVRVLIADRYRGLAFQADEPGYPPDQVELVAGVNLRNVLGLGDGDAVSFSVVGWDP